MSRAILMCLHKYTPFGDEFYETILDFQLKTLDKYKDEFDHIYFVDSNWNIKLDPSIPIFDKISIVRVNPSLRYYDAYKEVLPQVKEDLVLFMDNDLVVYKEGIIKDTFDRLSGKYYQDLDLKMGSIDSSLYSLTNDVVSITDTIGTMKVPLKTGNKFCPYFFATRKELLMKYLNVDWSPDAMPYTETFGLLTEAMLKDGLKPCEMEDDKTEVKNWNPLETEKTLGYYHVRAGTTIPMLLATKHYGDIETYNKYLREQPKSEILRHCDWFRFMGGDPSEILADL